MAIDRELTKLGHSDPKYAKKKKGDLGSLPTVAKKSEDLDDSSDKTRDDGDDKRKDEL